jgi:hypothetical protein
MKDLKGFRLDKETIEKYENLKKQEGLENDSDFFRKMLKYTEIVQNKKIIEIERYEEIHRRYEMALVEMGRLQGELNIIKQIALPKKEEKKWWQFWKRYSTDSERARASEVIETDKDKSG